MGEQEPQEQNSDFLFRSLFHLNQLRHMSHSTKRLQYDCNPLLANGLQKKWFTDTQTGDIFRWGTYYSEYGNHMEYYIVETKGIGYDIDLIKDTGGLRNSPFISFHINGEETDRRIFERCLESQQTPEEYMSS